jgi:cytochrome c oxidase cbb3-type subunit 1
VFNSLELPISPIKSYSSTPAAMDAMVQWWYGHNAVGFFLTAGFSGIMYYFVPKQAERPVYSYRLSIVHFWALIAIYMWAGRTTCTTARCRLGAEPRHGDVVWCCWRRRGAA